jgi:hypothetical protein
MTLGESLNKLIGISKYGALISKILLIVAAIGIAVAVIALTVIAVNPDLVIDLITVSEPLGVPIEDIDIAKVAAVLIPCILIIGALVIAMLYFIGRLFSNICNDKTPFTDDNSKCLVFIAILTVICTLVIPAVDFTVQWVIDSALYQSYGFGVFPLFVALMLYCLSLVFKHGAELQKEADQTL